MAGLVLIPLLMLLMGGGDDDASIIETEELVEDEDLTLDEQLAENGDMLDDDDSDDEPLFERTGKFVSESMFGTNVVYSVHTADGTPTERFEDAIDTFEIETVRFPAGQAEFQEGDTDGVQTLDITKLTEDGDLRPELTNFLDNIPGNVTLTVPTTTAPLSSYGENFAEWAELVMEEYGDKIDSIEIGNEYWASMGETEYGSKANIAITQIAEGVAAANNGDVDIIMQMASTFSQSEFNGNVDDRDFITRLTDANDTIIDQLSDQAREELDGVVEHYYWKKDAGPFDNSRSETQYMEVDFETWQSRFDQDLDFYITEWNVKQSNIEANGIRSASVLTEAVENMVELGVDTAHVWPLIHNTANDLGGALNDEEISTDEFGRVTETVPGAMFDLMSEALPGKELIRIDLEGVENDMEIAAYEGNGEFVFYIANTTNAPEEFTLDLRDLLPEFQSAEGVQVGYDRASSDGLHHVRGSGVQQADAVDINGFTYYLNEHDTGAELTDHSYRSPLITMRLDPFELMQITAR